MIERIAVLGGSSVYTPELILSLISHNINVKEIVLVGRPGPKLPLVADFCQRILDKSGFPAAISKTTSVADAAKDAAYVLNHVRVGGMKARLRDEKLPIKHGMVGDENLGAGGVACALRTLPTVLEHARTIEQANPDATVINMTDPVGVMVEAIAKYTSLKVVGVCDLPWLYIKKIAEVLRKEPADIWVDYIGLNHMGWIQDIKIESRSRMANLLECLEQHRQDGFDDDLIELFRMIPTKTACLFFHQDRMLKEQKSCGRFRAEELFEAEQQILKLYQNKRLNEVPDLTRERNPAWYEETIVPLIEAFESKTEHESVLCVQNKGCIRDLPDDCSVEVPVKVCRKGVSARQVGSCPHFLKGLFLASKESDRLVVEAAVHRSYECALQALTINPLVPSLDAARKYLDRIIREEKLELH